MSDTQLVIHKLWTTWEQMSLHSKRCINFIISIFYNFKLFFQLKEPKPNENNVIRAVHFAPNLKTMETMRIAFEEINNTCTATVFKYFINHFNLIYFICNLPYISKGESTSNEWFRVFDYGTNYCNLHNLVTGTGFDKSSKFLELTNNAVCTQYNMAVCQ